MASRGQTSETSTIQPGKRKHTGQKHAGVNGVNGGKRSDVLRRQAPLKPLHEAKHLKENSKVSTTSTTYTKSTNSTNSTNSNSTKSVTNPGNNSGSFPLAPHMNGKCDLQIRGVRTELGGQFKYLAKILNYTHADFLEETVASFCHLNPKIADRLTEQIVRLHSRPEDGEELAIRDIHADLLMQRTNEGLAKKALTMDAIVARAEMLERVLQKKGVSKKQKKEIKEYIGKLREYAGLK